MRYLDLLGTGEDNLMVHQVMDEQRLELYIYVAV